MSTHETKGQALVREWQQDLPMETEEHAMRSLGHRIDAVLELEWSATVDVLSNDRRELRERLADAIVSDAAELCPVCQCAAGTEDAGDEGRMCEPCAEAAAPYDGCGCGDFACPCGAPVRYGR